MWNDDHHLPQDLPPARQQILPEHLPLGSPWRLCPVLACSDYRCACAAPPGLPMPSVCLFCKRVPLRKKIYWSRSWTRGEENLETKSAQQSNKTTKKAQASSKLRQKL